MRTSVHHPPLVDYDNMAADELVEQLRFLSEGEIEGVLTYELETRNRREIVVLIERELALRSRHPAR